MEGRAGLARRGPRVRAVAARGGKLERARAYRGPGGQGLWRPHTPGSQRDPGFCRFRLRVFHPSGLPMALGHVPATFFFFFFFSILSYTVRELQNLKH